MLAILWLPLCAALSFRDATIYASEELRQALTTFCINENESCQTWANEGECDNNPGYMRTVCREACGTCQMGGYSDILLYGLRSARKLLPYLSSSKAKAVRPRIESAIEGILHDRHPHEAKGTMEATVQLLDEVLGGVTGEPEQLDLIGSDEPASSVNATIALNTGGHMPAVGFGTWQLLGQSAIGVFEEAIKAGYRHFDSAQGYANEAELGQAIKNSGIPRTEFFIATKLSFDKDLGKAAVRALVHEQLKALQTDYVDLYMFHGYFHNDKRFESWRELEKMYDEGLIKALGVSNYDVGALQDLFSYARVQPAVVQNKYSPFRLGGQFSDSASSHVIKYAAEKKIVVEGYSVVNAWPFQLSVLRDPFIKAIAEHYHRTPAQVVHRWALQHGVAIIPRSSDPVRMRESLQLFDFGLSPRAMSTIDGLNWLVASGANVPLYEDVLGLADSTRDKAEL